MGDVDLLLNHGSTRKILSLAKDLSDSKLESSICRTFTRRLETPPKKARNFNKHPRNISDESSSVDSSSESPVVFDRNAVVRKHVEKPTFQLHKTEQFDSGSEEETSTETLYKNKCGHKEPSDDESDTSEIKSIHCVVDSCDECECDVTIRKTPSDLIRDRRLAREQQPRRTIKSCQPAPQSVKNLVRKKVVRVVEEPPELCPGNCESPQVELKFVMDKRVKAMIEKSLKALEDIRLLMEFGIPPPDGAEDYQRRKKRSLEFASRFSRIYVYQLNRQIKEIQNILNPACGRNNRNKFYNLNQKMFASHQIVFQGLQAYHNHLPTSIAMGVTDKLKELLMEACTLCNMYRTHSDAELNEPNPGDIVDVFEIRCKSLLEKMDIISRISSKATLQMSNNNSKFSLLGMKSAPNESKSRFSMYHKVPVRKDVYWKKSIAALAQKKFDVPSRYKTATLAHRPPPVPIEPPVPLFKQIRHMQKSRKYVDKKSSAGTFKSRSIKLRMNDDNIETMIQAQDIRDRIESEVDLLQNNEEERSAPVNNLKNMAQQFFEKIFKEKESMTQSQYECVLEHFMNMVRETKTPQDGDDNSKLLAESHAESIEKKTQIALEEKLGKPIEEMEFQELFDRLVECAREGGKLQMTYARPSSSKESSPIVEGVRNSDEDVEFFEKKIKRTKKQTVTVTGAKNARLICIRDDNSIKESDIETTTSTNVSKTLLKKHNPKTSAKTKRRSTANDSLQYFNSRSTVAELQYKERRDLKSSTGSKVILNRLNKQNLRKLEMLPQETAVDIIQYKLEFHRNSKDNYMYKKCRDKSLWLLMGRISDKLLEEAMTIVTRDIQVDEILQKIYANEFK